MESMEISFGFGKNILKFAFPMKTITVKIPLNFDTDLMSVNEIDFEQIQTKLPEGQTIHKDPLLFKQEGDQLMVTFLVVEKAGKAGFLASKRG